MQSNLGTKANLIALKRSLCSILDTNTQEAHKVLVNVLTALVTKARTLALTRYEPQLIPLIAGGRARSIDFCLNWVPVWCAPFGRLLLLGHALLHMTGVSQATSHDTHIDVHKLVLSVYQRQLLL